MKGFFRKLRYSLPTRLLLVFLIVSLLITGLTVGTFFLGFTRQWQGGIRPHLVQYLNYISEDIGSPPDLERAQQLAERLPVNIYIQGPSIDYSSTGIPLDIEKLKFHKDRKPWRRHEKKPMPPPWRGKSKIAISDHRNRTILRNRFDSYTVYYEFLHRGPAEPRHRAFIAKALLLLVSIMLLSYLLLRRMLRPVQDIKQGVKRMGEGELDYRVPVRAKNDLGELATSINTMAGDIESMLDAKRQLLLALSHELRSPLSRAGVAIKMLDASAARSSIEDDLEEMERLIFGILEAEKMHSRHASLNKSAVTINSLIIAVTKEFQDVDLELDLQSDIPPLMMDDMRLSLLLRNLIGNAIKHGADSPVPAVVQTRWDGKMLNITVLDEGPGIPENHLEHITEPFYRPDDSRTRSTGGVGLGLYLCRRIAEAHGGSLSIVNREKRGVAATVLLPTEQIA